MGRRDGLVHLLPSSPKNLFSKIISTHCLIASQVSLLVLHVCRNGCNGVLDGGHNIDSLWNHHGAQRNIGLGILPVDLHLGVRVRRSHRDLPLWR